MIYCTMTPPPWMPRPSKIIFSDGKEISIATSGDVSGIPVHEIGKLQAAGWTLATTAMHIFKNEGMK